MVRRFESCPADLRDMLELEYSSGSEPLVVVRRESSNLFIPICDNFRFSESEVSAMAMIDMAATGRNIREMRVKAGMTIKDIQDACGVTSTSVCNWQKGKSVPTVDNLVILASIWHVMIDSIIVTCVA